MRPSAYDEVLPQPREVVARPGEFTFDRGTTLQPGTDDAALSDVRRLLAPLGLPLPSHHAGDVVVGIDPGAGPPEGYRLDVEPDRVRILGADRAGVRWAVQTLKQLMEPGVWRRATPGEPSWTVPCGQVQDAPALS